MSGNIKEGVLGVSRKAAQKMCCFSWDTDTEDAQVFYLAEARGSTLGYGMVYSKI